MTDYSYDESSYATTTDTNAVSRSAYPDLGILEETTDVSHDVSGRGYGAMGGGGGGGGGGALAAADDDQNRHLSRVLAKVEDIIDDDDVDLESVEDMFSRLTSHITASHREPQGGAGGPLNRSALNATGGGSHLRPGGGRGGPGQGRLPADLSFSTTVNNITFFDEQLGETPFRLIKTMDNVQYNTDGQPGATVVGGQAANASVAAGAGDGAAGGATPSPGRRSGRRSRSARKSKQHKKWKPKDLQDWEKHHMETMQKHQEKKERREERKRRKLAATEDAIIEAEERRRTALRKAGGWGEFNPRFTQQGGGGSGDDDSGLALEATFGLGPEAPTVDELRNLGRWRKHYFAKLEAYERQKKKRMAKLKAESRKAVKAGTSRGRPARLISPELLRDPGDDEELQRVIAALPEETVRLAIEGNYAIWEDGVVCPVQKVADKISRENDWVYVRLMKETKRRARHLAERQKKAQKDRAVVELEECFFEPQIRSSATVPEFPATIRDPKRQLGYEPRPYHGKRSADEVAAPTHTPVINERSRAIAEAKYPDAYTDPLTVSKRLAQSPAVRRRRATGGFEKRDEVTGELVAEDGDSGAEQQRQKERDSFRPKINRYSRNMSRDVTVYDRLYNIGMQQMLEKRRAQAEFWSNYTTLERPAELQVPQPPEIDTSVIPFAGSMAAQPRGSFAASGGVFVRGSGGGGNQTGILERSLAEGGGTYTDSPGASRGVSADEFFVMFAEGTA